MPHETYRNVPGMLPVTKEQAYQIAVARWSVQIEANRADSAGITWHGALGEVEYARWEELPAPISAVASSEAS
jgi:hypothetical protein